MKNLKKLTAICLVAAILTGTLVSCNSDNSNTPSSSSQMNSSNVSVASENSGEEKLAAEQVYSFSTGDTIIGLNPLINTTGPDNGAADFFLETLVCDVADEENKSIIKPGVAESWKISDDGLVYTFKIRDNAKWSDGVDITANDFLFTYRTMVTPEVASTNAWLFDGVIKNFSDAHYAENGKKPEDIGVKAIDDKTLEITLEKPCPYFLELLTGAKPVREDLWKKYGNEYGSSPDKVAMNGPFIIESWDQNIQMTLVKNPNYWDAENVKLEKINRKVLKDTATRVQALLSDQIDILGISDPKWRKMVEEDDRFTKVESLGNSPEFFSFNCSNKYFKNPKIRLAFSLGFDREKYVKELLHGDADPLYSMMPANTGVSGELYCDLVNNENQILKELSEKYPDPKALLIEGLKEEGFDPDPAKMDVTYLSRGTAEFSKQTAEWMLQEWREKLGVEVKIDMIEWNIMWDRVDQGDYDIATAGWGPYYNDPYGLLSIYDPVGGYFDSKKSGWTGPDADKFHELLQKSETIMDKNERAKVLLEAEKLLVGTGVIAPSYVGKSSTYMTKKIGGFHVNPHSALDYTLIYIKE